MSVTTKKYLYPHFFFLTLLLCAFSVLHASENNPDYVEALQKSIYFYEAQRSGRLPVDNRVEWRGDSALKDGFNEGVDLSGGWYDAGDHVKFGFPMAATTTLLAWGVVEYRQSYESSGQLSYILNNIRWATDYLMKAHTAPNELWGQVGNGYVDHAWWGAAEVMPMQRPAYKIDENCPGTDLAATTAAALAASSMIFLTTDQTYAQQLLEHAVELYQFADKFRGRYSDCITAARGFYTSSGYQDELVWGALWLYRATGDDDYLAKAHREHKSFIKKIPLGRWTYSWDDKSYGSYILFAQLTGKKRYEKKIEKWLDYWSDNDQKGRHVYYTPDGLARLDDWGPLRYAANTSLLALIYADYLNESGDGQEHNMEKVERYHGFAKNQIDYMLGKNSARRSYMVGFGSNYPRHPHHRTAHGSWANHISVPEHGRHLLYGALVGGPGWNDEYDDSRNSFIMGEATIDYNAGLTGALARLAGEYGGQLLADFPPAEKRDDEFFTEAKLISFGSHHLELDVIVNNRSAWPARVTKELSWRYFIDLSELVISGYSANDLKISLILNPDNAALTLRQWHVGSSIYYIEVLFADTEIYPGGEAVSKKKVRLHLSLPSTHIVKPNFENDWSFSNLTHKTYSKTKRISVYNGDEKLWGIEPDTQRLIVNTFPQKTAASNLNGQSIEPKKNDGGGGALYGVLLLLLCWRAGVLLKRITFLKSPGF